MEHGARPADSGGENRTRTRKSRRPPQPAKCVANVLCAPVRMIRCPSKHQSRVGYVDMRHRSIQIDLDMSICGIEASKSIWTCRCATSKHRNRFGHVDVRHRSIEIDLGYVDVRHRSIQIDLDMSMCGIEASKSIWICRYSLSMYGILERGSWNTPAEKYFRTLTSSLPVHYVFRTPDECVLEWDTF
jgi:hypothetical protein